jgi:hypothetical protein
VHRNKAICLEEVKQFKVVRILSDKKQQVVHILKVKISGTSTQWSAMCNHIPSLSPKSENSIPSPFREATKLENLFQIKATMLEKSYRCKLAVS